jgi:hypothetical protein|tara:strand:+ start:645 stop:1283 length:639 start_codon:yes stop_codon:yes gene_type:complete
MARYARGKKSNAIGDRSGFKVKYTNLKTTWDGLRVEPEDWEPKHPQLTPAKNVIDATALFNPRPDNDPDNFKFFVGFTQDWTVDPRTLPGIGMNGRGNVGNGKDSEVYIFTSVDVTGLAGTGAIGTEIPLASITETGVAATGAIGTISLVGSITETGVAGTGAVGVFGETDGPNMQLSITESGLAGTGAIGTEAVNIQGWGNSTWGQGTWGD